MKEIKFEELKIDTYQMFAKNWPLLTAGKQKKGYNTMTISWGHLGSLWGHNMPTVIVYVRPQRYTKKFVDENEYFKIHNCGLDVEFVDDTTYIKPSKIVLVCRKLYQQSLKEENFIDKKVMQDAYPNSDYHDMYIAQIEKVLIA